MELIYTASSNLKKEHITDDYPYLVSLSSKNVLAFCTTVEIESNKKIPPRCSVVTDYFIYICDIDKPWFSHQLVTSPHKIVSLEWHSFGQKLFYADDIGNCYIYEMKNILNVWEKVAHIHLGDCEILKAMWLKNENKISFLIDKKDSSSYYDKFQYENIYQPLFSGNADSMEGILLLTSSQLVLLTLSDDSPSDFNVTFGKYTKVEAMRRVCDAWLAEDRILVASTFGLLSSIVRIHSVFVEYQKGKLNLRCNPMLSFFIDHPKQNASCCCEPELTSLDCQCHQEIVFLKFISSDSIIVSYNINGYGHVELWQLIPEKVILGSLLANDYLSEFQPKDVYEDKWKKIATLSHNSCITSIAIPQLQVLQQQYGNSQQSQDVGYDNNEFFIQYVAVAYKDGSAKLVNRQTFVWMATTHLDTGNIDEKWECPEKKLKLMAPYLVHMQQSYTGCILLGIDQNCCIYVMKAINTRDPVTQVSSAALVGLFESLIMTSRDFWDVLAAVKPGSAEAIQHRLKENFKKQVSSIQEMNLNKLLSLDSLLAEYLNNPIKVGENYCRVRVFLINSHLKSRIFSKSINSIDSFTSEKFSQVCKNFDYDLDNLILNLPLDRKFMMDSQPSNYVIHLLRWCVSLATYLVCLSLPCTTATGRSYHMCNVQQIGGSLIGDANFLCAIREILVLVKMWSNVIPSIQRECNSIFNGNSISNNSVIDKQPQLFRLLTKICQYAHESKDVDDNILEECLCFAELNPKFSIPKSSTGTWIDPETLFGCNLRKACSMLTQNLPLAFTFHKKPSYENLKWRLKMDSVRQFYVDPFIDCRICSRCGNVSRREKSVELPGVLDSWEIKFGNSCCCGGLWRFNLKLN